MERSAVLEHGGPAEIRGALIAREIDGTASYSRLSVPILVTHGREDMIVLPSMAEHVLSHCRHLVRVLV